MTLTWDPGPHLWHSGAFPHITALPCCQQCGHHVWSTESDYLQLLTLVTAVCLPHWVRHISSHYYNLSIHSQQQSHKLDNTCHFPQKFTNFLCPPQFSDFCRLSKSVGTLKIANTIGKIVAIWNDSHWHKLSKCSLSSTPIVWQKATKLQSLDFNYKVSNPGLPSNIV